MRPVGRGARGWQVIVLAKAPVAGAVKTRLSPPLTLEQAADLAEAALVDTLAAAAATRACRRVLALDGPAGPWLDHGGGFEVLPQRGGALGERLGGAMDDAWAGCQAPMLLIGMDTPQVGAPLLDTVAERLLLGQTDAVLGPADDGGYWVIGTSRPVAGMFEGVPMSTGRTAAAQCDRLASLGVRYELVAGLRDVDEFADAVAVAAAAPQSRFAAALDAMCAPADAPAQGRSR